MIFGAVSYCRSSSSRLLDLLLPAEDIGDTPLELLQPVLLRCNAEQLASIEDGTRYALLLILNALMLPPLTDLSCPRNGGRELHDALQPHWQTLFIADFGSCTGPSVQVCQVAVQHYQS